MSDLLLSALWTIEIFSQKVWRRLTRPALTMEAVLKDTEEYQDLVSYVHREVAATNYSFTHGDPNGAQMLVMGILANFDLIPKENKAKQKMHLTVWAD